MTADGNREGDVDLFASAQPTSGGNGGDQLGKAQGGNSALFSTTKILTVGELTRAIRGTLETKFGGVWVGGEISNYRPHPSGHQYFTLKDQRAQISCVIFRNTLPPFQPPLKDGAQVQIFGNVSVFEARGQYQLSVQLLQGRGLGLLQAKFEALKIKLEAEGLFARARKRPLPRFPRRIGIVTAPGGAAIQDMLNVLARRAPNVHVLINPVRVQGKGAATEIAVAIRELNEPSEGWAPLDLIVIARGGGSIEDLWEFNEEILARAIFESRLPVVSAVGHEIDFTIADFVADLRAPTPSAAAELIVADTVQISQRVAELGTCLARNAKKFFEQTRVHLRFLSERTLAREIVVRMQEAQQQLDLASESLRRTVRELTTAARHRCAERGQAMRAFHPARELANYRAAFLAIERRVREQPTRALIQARERFRGGAGMLRVLGPDGTLQRGYSITKDGDGNVIRSTHAVGPRMLVRTTVADGEFVSEVRDAGADSAA